MDGRKRRWIGFLCLVMAVSANAGPFVVNGSLRRTADEGMVLTVSISVPQSHFLYAKKVRLSAEEPVRLEPVSLPKAKQKKDPFSGRTEDVYDHDVTFVYRVLSAPESSIRAVVHYQGCNDETCFLPQSEVLSLSPVSGEVEHELGKVSTEETPVAVPADMEKALAKFEVRGSAGGYLGVAHFVGFLDGAESGGDAMGGDLARTFSERGAWFVILLVLFSGVLLNLTPCVLPMIPINIAIIGAGARAGSRLHGFAMGGLYGAGIAVVYGILGVLAVTVGTTFGTLNASPWFNFSIAVLFLILATAAFGVFHIDFSRFQQGVPTGISQRWPYLTAFLLGAVAGLLAGACVAPVLISVVVLSANLYAAGNVLGLALPFLLGIGMAIPWPFAGAGLSFLPKPGKWMGVVRYIFGFTILAVAIWYAYLGFDLLKEKGTAEQANVAEIAGEGAWHASPGKALQEAIRQEKPVFIDFWATWCKSCAKMERTTFRDPRVKERLAGYVKLKFQAEDPTDPATKVWLDRFDVIGLPTYVVLWPKIRRQASGEDLSTADMLPDEQE